jgi:hypothetical protein
MHWDLDSVRTGSRLLYVINFYRIKATSRVNVPVLDSIYPFRYYLHGKPVTMAGGPGAVGGGGVSTASLAWAIIISAFAGSSCVHVLSPLTSQASCI